MKQILTTITAALALAIPQFAQAGAFASGAIAFDTLEMTPTAGTLELVADWELTAFAEARNSLGESDADFDQSFTGGIVSTDAVVTWASGAGVAVAPTFFPPDFRIGGSADSLVDLPDGFSKSADSLGNATLINGFTVTGGTGIVDVDFSVHIAGFLDLLTANEGLWAETEVILTLEIFDLLPDIGGNPQDQIVLSFNSHERIGPDDRYREDFDQMLNATRSVNYDEFYFFSVEVDSESESAGEVPAPPVVALMMVGLIGLIRFRKGGSMRRLA